MNSENLENRPPPKRETDGSVPQINITYRKMDSYQIYHVDGFMSGITPRGYINLEVYAERAAIPRVMTHPIIDGKKIGPGKPIEGIQGFLRMIHCGMVIDLATAENMIESLKSKVSELKSLLDKAEDKGNVR